MRSKYKISEGEITEVRKILAFIKFSLILFNVLKPISYTFNGFNQVTILT